MKITRFEDIDAWVAARAFAKAIYNLTKDRPFAADEALKRQMRRAAASVMANIAEGFDGGSDAEFARFLSIARRSATEVQSHLYIALDQECIKKEQFDRHYADAMKLKKLIGGFIRYLRGDVPGKKSPPGDR